MCAFGRVVGGWGGNRGPLCDGQGGPEPRASACMQKLQRYNRPLTPASQEGIHPMPGEQRAGLVLLTRRGRKEGGWEVAGLMTFQLRSHRQRHIAGKLTGRIGLR